MLGNNSDYILSEYYSVEWTEGLGGAIVWE